jgi:Uma2 family endonuclease
MAAEPLPRRFTVAEYYRMGKAGILDEDDRVELIEGEIIQMPPIGDPHAWGVNRLTYAFISGLGERAIVAIQNPLRLTDLSEPVPDVVVMRPRPDGMRGPHPTAKDVFLVVEVSDTTLAYDQRRKIPLYAHEDVPEVWVVDLSHQRLWVYRDPNPDGYRTTLTLERGDRVSPVAFPDLVLAVDDILG